MPQVAFLTIALSVLTLVIAFIFKKHQRAILWTAALTLFIGTSLLLGLGLVKIVENGVVNQTAVLAVILSFICSAIFACNAEKIHAAMQKKASAMKILDELPQNDNPVEANEHSDEELNRSNEHVQLPQKLNTKLACDIFSKAIEKGFMEEKSKHYKWNLTKVLLGA